MEYASIGTYKSDKFIRFTDETEINKFRECMQSLVPFSLTIEPKPLRYDYRLAYNTGSHETELFIQVKDDGLLFFSTQGNEVYKNNRNKKFITEIKKFSQHLQ